MLLPGSSCSEVVKWWTESAFGESRSMGTSHFALCQRERKAVAEFMLSWKHEKTEQKTPPYVILVILHFKVLVNSTALLYLHIARLTVLYFKNIQNLIRISWGPFQPCLLLFGVLDSGLSDHIFYLPPGHLFISLLCPFKAIVGNWVEWTLRTQESSHFYKAIDHFIGDKSHFDKDIKGLMGLFHHI